MVLFLTPVAFHKVRLSDFCGLFSSPSTINIVAFTLLLVHLV